MAILAKKPESTFSPAPEGLHHAVCVDVVDLGLVKSVWGEKHKVWIVWQIEEMNLDNGKRFDVRKQYTLSLHEKAGLRKDLESWRGRKFTEEELTHGFDLEKLLKVNCQIQVVRDVSEEGKTYANVQAVVPAPKNVLALAPLDYVRQKDRATATPGNGKAPLTDDDIPF